MLFLSRYSVLICILNCMQRLRALDNRDELKSYVFVEVNQHNKHVRHKRDLSTKHTENLQHFEKTNFVIFANEQRYSLHLTKNSELTPMNYKQIYQNKDGSTKVNRKERTENCFYHGKIEHQEHSTVIMSTCNGLRGLIEDENGERLFIEPVTQPNNISRHILYNMDDLIPKQQKYCKANSSDTEETRNKSTNRLSRGKRSVTSWNYVETVVVVDFRKHTQWGGSVQDSENKAMEIMNYVDAVYKTIRTRIAVIAVIVWNVNDKISVTDSASSTLSKFSKYTADVIHGDLDIYNDNSQLISGIDFDGSMVGLAGVGVICGLSSCAVNQDHSSNPAVSANTVAHELGHNLGFLHNDGSCTCLDPPCVMEASSPSSAVQGFSSCAIEKFETQKLNGRYPCLSDYPQTIFGPSTCGDGYLNENEECDCGNEQDCITSGADKCCAYATCTLQADAECADGDCCESCKFKSQGSLCRDQMDDDCDLKEYCFGNSNHCPRNFYVADGKVCGNEEGYCFKGMCRIHTQQCETLWGSDGSKAEDACFNLNLKGDDFGNCGKDEHGSLSSCTNEDRLCGKIQCQAKPGKYLPTWPLLGSNRRIKSTTFYVGGISYNCKAVKMSFPSELDDPTMTFDGTKCSNDSVCVGNKCKNLTLLQNNQCDDRDCKNGGVCNNNGNCHCPYGFACPYCTNDGLGGSVDSGQGCSIGDSASDLYFLFLLLVPLVIGGAVFLLYRLKPKLFRKNKVSPAKNVETNEMAAK